MTICGIEMAGSEARLVLVDGTKEKFNLVEVEPRKLVLANDEDHNEVKAFRNSMFAFFRENNVSLVVIKKRGKTGEYTGGPTGFKLEGIAQLYENCPVRLIPSQTVSAAQRRYSPCIPDSLRKYQHNAFKTAFSALQ